MKLIERQSCPLCEHPDSKIIHKESYSSKNLVDYINKFYGNQGYPSIEDLSAEYFQVDECNQCKMLFQKYIPDNDSLNELYTKWISFDKVYNLYERQRSLFKLDQNYIMLRNVIGHLNNRRIKCFDYGFGYAHLLRQAQIFGMDVYGTEFNTNQVKLAKKQGIKIVDFEKESPPYMDVIFCEQVLEHTVSPRLIMYQIQKMAKKGTILHLSVPDSKRAKKILQNIDWDNIRGNKDSVMCFAPLEHINSFRNKNLIDLASDFGFKRVHLNNNSRITHEITNFNSSLKYVYTEIKFIIRTLKKAISSHYSTDLFFEYHP